MHLAIDPLQESALHETHTELPLHDSQGHIVAYLISPDLLTKYHRPAEEQRITYDWAGSLFEEEVIGLAESKEAIYSVDNVLKLLEQE